MGWIVGYEEGMEGKREDSRESGERVALSELRIIITVVVGARRHRGCEGYAVMGQEERRTMATTSVRVQGDGKGCIYPSSYTPAPAPRTDLDGNLRHSEALAKKIG